MLVGLLNMLDGGDHYDDIKYSDQCINQRRLFQRNNNNPRKYVLHKIELLGLENKSKCKSGKRSNSGSNFGLLGTSITLL